MKLSLLIVFVVVLIDSGCKSNRSDGEWVDSSRYLQKVQNTTEHCFINLTTLAEHLTNFKTKAERN